jgi:hypothetical protein
VESRLAGHDERIKEYVIGREVFDRGDDYDPRLDPIVRVEARRLRSRLSEYYSGPGRDEPMRLEYPKGRYLPEIRPVEAPAHDKLRRGRTWWVAGVAALVLFVVIAAFVASRSPIPPMLAPIPTTWIETHDATLDAVDVALAEDVDAALANRPGTHVIAWPEIVRKKPLRFLALSDFASELGANRLLLILVRDQGLGELVRVFVVDEPSGRKRLALTYSSPGLSTFSQQDALAGRIALDVTSPTQGR